MRDHDKCWQVCKTLPTDFEPYGHRERDGEDCSCGCKFFFQLKGSLGSDWGVCVNPESPRAGLLTFEHLGCELFEYDPEIDNEIERILNDE